MREPVKKLWCGCLDVTPQHYDFYEKSLGEDWDIPFNLTDEEMEREEFYPMMNYIYPLEEFKEDDYDDLKKIVKKMSTVTIITIDEDWFLALTGGGMNLQWEICEAYMLLGFLPPTYFCDLLGMCKRLSVRNKWIIAGCRRSLRIERKGVEHTLGNLRSLVEGMKERTEKEICNDKNSGN